MDSKKPRWKQKWKFKKSVNLWEAILLSLDIDPDSMRDEDGELGDSISRLKENREFQDRLDVTVDYLSDKKYFNLAWLNMASRYMHGVHLNEFAAFAMAVPEWEIPDELAELGALQASAPTTPRNPMPETVEAAINDAPENWKTRVQAEAAQMIERGRKQGAQPVVHSIIDDLARWCRDNGIKTKTGIFPSAAYLRTHVLSGKHWTPPK